MLSQNPTNLQQRQRQHRRQQSTPTAFEATKVPDLPTIQRHGSHRRGMSLDQRQRRRSPPQDIQPVNYTNQGFNDNQQHKLREAQQQRLARQGQQFATFNQTIDDDQPLISPFVTTPQRQSFDAGYLNSYGALRESPSPYSPYSDDFNAAIQVNQIDYADDNHLGNDSLHFSGSGNVTPSAFFDFSMSYDEPSSQQDWGATIRPNTRTSAGRRVSGGIADRVARFEGMGAVNQTTSRPSTPPSQNDPNFFPPTPATTPFNRGLKAEVVPQRFSESYDTSMEETLKPVRNRSTQRAQTIFQEMRDRADCNQPPSPPGSNPMPSTARFENSAPMPTSSRSFMPNLRVDLGLHDGLAMDFKADRYQSSECSPTYSQLTPAMSQQSSPEISHASLLGSAFENRPHFETTNGEYHLPQSLGDMDLNDQMSPTHDGLYHRRSESVDSINLDESITDTGITIDDIAHYIDGPDAVDQKWVCLFPECGKRFGRKENIKSHVQTHLGDRQFQCPHCKKCFVRQHDLKRHAKIHSGVKPYPCACGNSFARHDALTRHRQRGMCCGAFEGVVKKVVKRGRPRKPRPDDEERLEKSSKTRSKNRKAMSSASSPSAYSESYSGQSPANDNDVLDQEPFGDFVRQNAGDLQYTPAASPLPTDYVSPQAMMNAPSPSALSTRSHYSHASYSHHSHRGSVVSIADLHSINNSLPPHPASPAKSTTSQYNTPAESQYNTPPELCLSSSSPPPSSQFYDPTSEETVEDMDLSSKIAQMHNLEMSDHEDDMFLENFGSSVNMGMSLLEQDPDMLLGSKFDDSFGVVNDNEDMLRVCDVFFGSP